MTEKLDCDVSRYGGDVYLYYGDISRRGYARISDILESKEARSERACLVLVTYGGNPDAGYRIARALHHYYRKLDILIPDVCKSAGTLICIGATGLIFGDRGELGPLDIQLSKPDEMFESVSGLDIMQAINALSDQVLMAFRSYLVDIRGGSRISTTIAADLASKLADGFVSPIACKIDPMTLGAHQRAIRIAYDYGNRLDEMVSSLKPDALSRLVSDYPSHAFVIDRKEAGSLFKQVSAPSETTLPIYNWARDIIGGTAYPPSNSTIVVDVKEFQQQQTQRSEVNESQNEPAPSKYKGASGIDEAPKKTTRQGQGDKRNGSGVSRGKAEVDVEPREARAG